MRKVKLTFKYDELNAIYGDLHNNVVPIGLTNYTQKIIAALLTQLYMKLASKVLFRTDKKIKLSIDLATACALVLYINSIDIDHSNYTHNIYMRILTDIDQQLQ